MARRPAHTPLNVFLNGVWSACCAGNQLAPWTSNSPRIAGLARYFPDLALAAFTRRYIGACDQRRRQFASSQMKPSASVLPNGSVRLPPMPTACSPYSAIQQLLSASVRTKTQHLDRRRSRKNRTPAQGRTLVQADRHRGDHPHLKPHIGRLPNGIDPSISVENICALRCSRRSVFLPPRQRSPTSGNAPTLIVERFDRLWVNDGRLLCLPQENMCPALSDPPTRRLCWRGGASDAQDFRGREAGCGRDLFIAGLLSRAARRTDQVGDSQARDASR